MSDWHDKIKRAATFRGVPFFIDSAEQGGGRRGPSHEFPFKSKNYKEDTGLKGRTFPLEGFVLGLDYMDRRNALIDALETEGPGELVHPHYGTRRVAVDTFRVRESTEGGVARFSIEFSETDAEPSQPSAVADTKGALASGAAAATAAVGAEFLAKFNPGALLASVSGALRSGANAINSLLAKADMEVQTLAALKTQVLELSGSAVNLVNDPGTMLAQNIAIFEGLADGLIAQAGAIDPCGAVLALYAFNPGVRPPGTTATRLQEQANFDATQRLYQRLAVIQAAKIAVGLPFASFDEAVATRERITDLLDEQALIVSDDTFPALAQLRADLVRAVPGDALEFDRLLSYTPITTVPSLVLAHQLYGDLSLEADLIARNKIANPTFVTGGVPLEVISRAE